MGSHFAKHLSPLVLVSEHEMSLDSVAATAILRWVSWVPSQGLFYRGGTLNEGLLGATPRHPWVLMPLQQPRARIAPMR